MLNYTKLWLLLESKGMKKTDLKQVISSVTLAKLSKNETISSDTIEKICGFLHCQPGDIMEYISEEQIKEVTEQIDTLNRIMAEQLKAKGISEEQWTTMMLEMAQEMAKNMYRGGTSTNEIQDKVIEKNIKTNL